MRKGEDYIGVSVSFFCHDGEGNYIMAKRNKNCRDEHGRWDFGGGGVKFGESLESALKREVKEEYGTNPLEFEYLGHAEVFREHEGKPTHWVKFRYKVLLNRDEVLNMEPNKHDEIAWFKTTNLPAPLHSQLNKCLEGHTQLPNRTISIISQSE
jgi:ADP-ribose pyrophosphatase YjhB (NUDIX family)